MTNFPFFAKRPLDALEAVVKSPHTGLIATGEHTHDPGYQWVWERVREGWNRDEVTAGFKALLPSNYAGNSQGEIAEWYKSARAKLPTVLDTIKPKKPSPAQVLLRVMTEEGMELFHDALRRHYMSVVQPSGGRLTYLLQSQASQRVLRRRYYELTSDPPKGTIFDGSNRALPHQSRFRRRRERNLESHWPV